MWRWLVRFLFLLAILAAIYGLWFLQNNSNLKNDFVQLAEAKIIVPEKFDSLNPYSNRAFDQQFLKPIYEPLISLDADLRPVPALAFTYGQVDDTTWQMELRPNIRFHDQTTVVTPELVQANFQFLKANLNLLPESLANFVTKIGELSIQNQNQIVIRLTEPEPEFLYYLSQIPILPTPIDLAKLENQPNGTGPYLLQSASSEQVIYTANPNYWGQQAVSKQLIIKVITDPILRAKSHTTEPSVELILPYPNDIPNLHNEYEVKLQPDLTTYFFIWNRFDPLWEPAERRALIRSIFPYELVAEYSSGLGLAASQFVSSGIFGYNPDIKLSNLTPADRQNIISQSGLKGETIRLAVPESFQQFGTAIEAQLQAAGLNAEVYAISEDQLLNPEYLEGIHLVLLGWQNSSGTSSGFLYNFLEQNAQYNISNYENTQVSSLLMQLEKEIKDKKRNEQLQQIMAEIVLNDPFGLPVMYGQRSYLVKKESPFRVGLDGVVRW